MFYTTKGHDAIHHDLPSVCCFFMRINSYGSTNCIRFEGIISALMEGTLLMFDGAKVRHLIHNSYFIIHIFFV